MLKIAFNLPFKIKRNINNSIALVTVSRDLPKLIQAIIKYAENQQKNFIPSFFIYSQNHCFVFVFYFFPILFQPGNNNIWIIESFPFLCISKLFTNLKDLWECLYVGEIYQFLKKQLYEHKRSLVIRDNFSPLVTYQFQHVHMYMLAFLRIKTLSILFFLPYSNYWNFSQLYFFLPPQCHLLFLIGLYWKMTLSINLPS